MGDSLWNVLGTHGSLTKYVELWAVCMRRECRERFPRHLLQRKPLVSDPGMHHGTCVVVKTFPVFLAYAQPAILRIWQEAHSPADRMPAQIQTQPFPYSLSSKTSCRQISWSIEATGFGLRLFQSLWYLTGSSERAQTRGLANFRAIPSL